MKPKYYLFAIRCKETNTLRNLCLTTEPSEMIAEFRAQLAGKQCAYNMFPDNYEFVIRGLSVDIDDMMCNDGETDHINLISPLKKDSE